ncbi:MAG: hypothetical protein MZV64_74200 [Ignavibacteriales bacterium]|nr:hypothetical protein [Ignavibacteriales bacterium]
MIEHVVDLAAGARTRPNRRHRRLAEGERSTAQLAGRGEAGGVCEQIPQLGTGHAVMQSERALDGFRGDVLVLSGDVPLLDARRRCPP